MVIRADDELCHPSTDMPEWRESMWWSFNLPEHEMGGAIYYSYMPNTSPPSARLIVYIGKGWLNQPNSTLYHLDLQTAIPDSDWDNLVVDDIAHFKRIEPLKKWQIDIDDKKRLKMSLEIDVFAGTWHYIDNLYETPKYLAGDRYHRPYAATGSMCLDGKDYDLDFTGDADHSWGPRRWEPLFKSKYIAGQCGQRWAFSLMETYSADGGAYPYGFIWDGTGFSPITNVEVTPLYDVDGIQKSVVMNLVDNESRNTFLEGQSYCSIPTQFDQVTSIDTFFNFKINNGEDTGSGIMSFFWNRVYHDRVLKKS